MYLGIEIGGTKLQAGLGKGTGKLQSLHRIAARSTEGRQGICRQLAELVRESLAEGSVSSGELAGVGIGFGGPVDSGRGLVLKSHQVAGWEEFDLVGWFREELGLMATLGNDSDLAGLAESHYGAGRGFSPVAYMNIGSGIGGALVVDGKLYVGQGRGAAEIGHLRILPGEPGQPWRTLESLCSGWSLAECARVAFDREPGSRIRELAEGSRDRVSTEILVEAVRQQDPAAMAIWETAIEQLAVAMANVMTLFNPACFVVGGGVGMVGAVLFDPLRRALERQQFVPFANSWKLAAAELGEEVVVHGAIKLAADARAFSDDLGRTPSAG